METMEETCAFVCIPAGHARPVQALQNFHKVVTHGEMFAAAFVERLKKFRNSDFDLLYNSSKKFTFSDDDFLANFS